MLSVLKQLAKRIPTLLLSLALGVAVWISAVTAADPVKEQVYPRPVPLELIGQDPGLLLVSSVPTQVTVTLSAPNSIWDRILNATNPVRAVADLSGLAAGSHVVPVQIQVAIRPVEIRSTSLQSLDITLEAPSQLWRACRKCVHCWILPMPKNRLTGRSPCRRWTPAGKMWMELPSARTT